MQAFCLASGPSLTLEDVEKVHQWREAGCGFVIAVNRTFEVAPWADHFCASDGVFWANGYGKHILPLPGRKWSASKRIPYTEILPKREGNSGASAIRLAESLGATRIYLLGYDVAYSEERRHWHSDYPRGFGNAGTVLRWTEHFQDLSRDIKAEVLNCTRGGKLEVWTRAPLEQVTALGYREPQ